MKDKDLRKKLLENGTFRDYTVKRRKALQEGRAKEMYKEDVIGIAETSGEVETALSLDASFFDLPPAEAEECERIRSCRKKQREKIEDHVKYLFEKEYYDLFFVTFTFSDECLDGTKAETRKRNITRLLKSSADYILNIDYGEKTEREHYHCIMALEKGSYHVLEEVDFCHKGTHKKAAKLDTLQKYEDGLKYGFYTAEKIEPSAEKSAEKLSRYITKLTCHSIKVAQTYVSVKKGSEYQQFKNMREKVYKSLAKKMEDRRTTDIGRLTKWGEERQRNIHGLLTAFVEREMPKTEETRLL